MSSQVEKARWRESVVRREAVDEVAAGEREFCFDAHENSTTFLKRLENGIYIWTVRMDG